MDDQIEVSVICNAFNHGKYIRDALEGFVSQRTTFAYEVLVHDDASTDDTAQIIREFENRYPKLIKPIYQSENQYSQHISVSNTYQYPRAAGRYYALCEGDDYWTDPYKLQKQFDLMEAHPEVDLCACGYSVLDMNTGEIKVIPSLSAQISIIPARDVIRNGGGFFATASLFFRAELQKNIPEFRKLLNFDYTLQIHGALRGGVLFVPDNMCVYRTHVNASWTDRMCSNREYNLAFKQRMQRTYRQLNRDTHGKYRSVLYHLRIKNFLWIVIQKLGFFPEDPFFKALRRFKANIVQNNRNDYRIG